MFYCIVRTKKLHKIKLKNIFSLQLIMIFKQEFSPQNGRFTPLVFIWFTTIIKKMPNLQSKMRNATKLLHIKITQRDYLISNRKKCIHNLLFYFDKISVITTNQSGNVYSYVLIFHFLSKWK